MQSAISGRAHSVDCVIVQLGDEYDVLENPLCTWTNYACCIQPCEMYKIAKKAEIIHSYRWSL